MFLNRRKISWMIMYKEPRYGIRGCIKHEPEHHGVSMARIGKKHRKQGYLSRFS
jgi:hypothetical protein